MQHDEETISAAIRGDRLSLQLLLKAEKEKLYRMAYTYVKNEEDALTTIGKGAISSLPTQKQIMQLLK